MMQSPMRWRPGPCGLDVPDHQQRDLPLSEALVGVALDPQPGGKLDGRDRDLGLALFGTRVDGDDRARLRGGRGHERLRKTPLFPPRLKSRRRRTISAPRSTALTMA